MLGCAHRRFGEEHQFRNRFDSFVRGRGFHHLVRTSFEHDAHVIYCPFVLEDFPFFLRVEGLEMSHVCPFSPLPISYSMFDRLSGMWVFYVLHVIN